MGIGLFIVFIGLQGAKLIVDGSCLTTLVSFRGAFRTNGLCAVLALIGLFATVVLFQRRVKGAILIGILFTWALGMLCQAAGIYHVDPEAKMYSLYPSLNLSSIHGAFREFGSLFGQCLDADKWSLKGSPLTGWKLLLSGNFLVVMFTLLFDDLFNTLGTLTDVASTANMLDKDGKMPRLKQALLADAVATTAGALLGATTTTSYVESATGVSEGGRTGLTSYVTAALFLASILLAPLFTAIPGFATAPALIMVGFLMIGNISQINFNDLTEAFPCLLACDHRHAVRLQHRRRDLLRLHRVDGRESGLRTPRPRECHPDRLFPSLHPQIHPPLTSAQAWRIGSMRHFLR